ncbi:ABC transporter related protein [Thermobaculum terrenum ATCC BAA-798]|uniref:ABC transporter related protein n=1 Tax=Thermobaculum terrenum (strain ATCC BAA-798 / CCMEE 7001 / YNP1) TaxID=525904 RepID=D1CIY6_THET1|nr:ABC transporter ATP-binding protein [Thermobaculum terrenum]ACZ43706.1 ABC transporter related protein [Thermobaculum terrenum ATCC BAA-798]
MRYLLRYLSENRKLWRVWLPLLVLSACTPLLAISIPVVEKRLIDGVLLARRMDLLPGTLALYGLLWLLTSVIGLIAGPMQVYLNERLSMDLRQRLFAQCERLSLAFARREHTGRTLALFVNDAPSLASLFSSTLLGGVSSLIAIVVGIFVMFRLNWQLSLAAGIIPPIVAILAAIVTRPLRPAARRAQEKAAELTERLQENLAGLREVVAFGRGRLQHTLLSTTLMELLRLRMRVAYIDTAIGAGQSVFSLTVSLVIVGYGGYLVLRGETTIGTLVAIRTLFTYVFQPAGQLVGLASSIQKGLGSADRIYAFLDREPQVKDLAGSRASCEMVGEVAFEGVSFGYSSDSRVLHDVSFVARAGETVALVGPSGAGKSTLVSLIARFYDPQEGRVLIDGRDIRELPLDELRSRIAIVFQDTFLFATTVRENIAFGREGATEEEIIAAAKAANAWEFIQQLPDGLDTLVGERGVRFSEGQKQRLAIARALLRKPLILILDEPTSALDARSEHLLQEALENLMRGCTAFVIAHRLATVQRADRILVMEGGRIVEQGTHHELLEQGGLYQELFDLQFAPRVDGQRLPAALT